MPCKEGHILETEHTEKREPSAGKVGQSCAEIDDPTRRALCKICGVPILREAPFCKDHEYPVP